MYCSAVATGLRLLARCLVRSRSPILPLPSDLASLDSMPVVDAVLSSSNSSSNWTVVGETSRKVLRCEPLCAVDEIEIECRLASGFLQAHVKTDLDVHQQETPTEPRLEPPSCGWLDGPKQVEFVCRVVRCEMTVEGVDEVLGGLYGEMNGLVGGCARDRGERARMAREVCVLIKEYAEVLLESACEVRLAVERARVRCAGLRRFTLEDVAYLALLAPGSSHVVGCDRTCVKSYLPYRGGLGGLGLLSESGSVVSSPSEVPSTPRLSMGELRDEQVVIVGSEEEKPEIVPVEKMFEPKTVRKTKVVRLATRSARPAWR